MGYWPKEHLNASSVFDRIEEAMGCETDAELAWWLGTSRQSLSNRRRANSVPYREAIFVARWSRLSLEYLLNGDSESAEMNLGR
ncbi:helix-turn-helix domain-containing protein [Mesorhizobium shangrilense]|uniref:Helix-turn-helix domain-containing protein n=1 Tax=Mesorhizobium shangrilense TaxID=460060 RepID=A0ABV2DMY5_9HYPH